jgi:Raf kinase inhibitor-like YbhB/YbcL family protein
MRLFVSYARTDRPKVDPLARRLRHAGNDAWLDIDLVGGQVWWDKILHQIRGSDAFIAIVSRSSLKSEACRIERQYAAQLGKPILPLTIEPLSAGVLPSDISRLQMVDYSRPDEDTAYALIGAIMRLPTPPPLPVPLPEPPDAPFSHWGSIGDQINAQTLTLDQQFAIVGHLESALAPTADPAEIPIALDLLSQMEQRVDLYAAVGRKIALLKQNTSNGPGATLSTEPAGPGPTPRPVTAQPSTARRPASQTNQKGTAPGVPARDRSSIIREWAKQRGYKVNERGRIPAAIIAEYESTPTRTGDRKTRTGTPSRADGTRSKVKERRTTNDVRPPLPYDFLRRVPSFTVLSDDISDGQMMSRDQVHNHFSMGGANISPQLRWHGFPAAAQSFAVTCFDPDSQTGSGLWHWLVLDIPASVTALAAGAGSGSDLPVGAFPIRNDFGGKAYNGPAPPAGDPPHRYVFAVHALDVASLGIDSDVTAAFAGLNLYFHTIARAVVVPVYGH